MTNANCPDKEELSEYALGTLNDEAVAGLEEHLSLCEACAQTMSELDTCSDGFTALLRQSRDDSDLVYLKEDGYAQILAGLSQLKICQLPSQRKTAYAIPAATPSESMVGRQLGQYQLLEIVGRGGMGLVYKAQHTLLNKTVALKVLSGSRVHDPRMQERFHREMLAAGSIKHANVVHASDASNADGVHYLVMELVDGVDLSVLLKSHGPFSVGQACELIRMVAVGLEQIHLAGMVHRDIKPGNLMLARDGQVKILDLGLALLNPQYAISEGDLTSTGQLMGTVDYMSPEQADNTHNVDGRADIYGLGATLFALLCGRAPFGGRKLSLMNKLSLLANEPAPSIQEFCLNAPDGLAGIVSRMLARDPKQRFASAAEVALALEPYCSTTGIADLLPASGSQSEMMSIDSGDDVSHDTILLDSTNRSDSSVVESAATANDLSILHRSHWILLSVSLIVVLAGILWLLRSGANATVAIPNRPTVTDAPALIDAATVIDAPVEAIKVETHPVVSRTSSVVLEHLQKLSAEPVDAAEASDGASSWQIFSASTEPDLRTTAIHQACKIVPAASMLCRLLTEDAPSIRAGLMLAISEYDQFQVLNAAEELKAMSLDSSAPLDLIDLLLRWYVNDPDSEVHSSVEFLLRSWGQQDRLQQLRPLLEQKLVPFDGGWYQPYHVSAMVIIPGPRTEQIGSPIGEPGRNAQANLQKEDLRSVTVPYSFAISSTEVTRTQFWRISDGYWKSQPPTEPQAPAHSVYWHQAAEFCNRLSELEGILPAEFCYVQVDSAAGVRRRQKPNALELTGYRLPTDDEWEIACRAGTSTIRPHGDAATWLYKYVIGNQTEAGPVAVGLQKPNPFGLFDMLGNVSEWIHTADSDAAAEKGIRRLRGGSAWTAEDSLRSATRNHYESHKTSPKVGIRVARTILKRPYLESGKNRAGGLLEIQVGPPVCPAELATYVGQEFHPLDWQQVIRLGHWNVRHTMTRRFRLRNVSDEPVTLSQLPRISGFFEFDPEPPLRIEPNATVDFGLRMPAVIAIGERTHDLDFQWGRQNEYHFPPIRIHGCLDGPFLEVFGIGLFGQPPAVADMGVVPMGSQVGIRLFLRNIGNQPVEARVTNVTGPFKLASPLEGIHVPHVMDKSFRIVLNATTTGATDGEVTLVTNEEPPSEYQFPIHAVVSDSKAFSAVGVFRNGLWLIDNNRDAEPDETFEFGTAGDHPLTGDWNGDGICDVAVSRPTSDDKLLIKFRLRGENPQPALEQAELVLGDRNWRPIAADRDGDGRTEIGYVKLQATGEGLVWAFDTPHDGSFQDKIVFGLPNDDLVVGDWNGDGMDDFAVSRPNPNDASGARLWQISGAGLGSPREHFYLSHFDLPIAGDWDGDGDDDPGGWRPWPESKTSVWQFETDGDVHSNCDLEGFGLDTDIPFVLRHAGKLRANP